MKTYIIGHKNPDTDSIAASIALEALEKELGKDYAAAVAGDLNRETEYVLDRFAIETPTLISDESKEVILVDHNEPSQIHENVKTEEIKAIFDHHKLGGLSLSKPISIRIKPVGSISTIITDVFLSKKVVPSAEIASLLIAGIISDTLNFTSPTAADKDKKALEYLNQIAKLDIEKLAEEMFKAKSDITGIEIPELIAKDYKVFDIKGKRVGIGVWETVLPDTVLEKKKEILKELEIKKSADGADLIFFAVVDILKNGSTFFSIGGDEDVIIEKAFKVKINDNLADLHGIVSRKSQIAPKIETAL